MSPKVSHGKSRTSSRISRSKLFFVVVVSVLLVSPLETNAVVDEVVDFLSTDECDAILIEYSQVELDLTISDALVGRSRVRVGSDIKQRIAVTMAGFMSTGCGQDSVDETCKLGADAKSRLETYMKSSLASSEEPELYVSNLTRTTVPHADLWFNPGTNERGIVKDKVGIVFLDEVPGALFAHFERQVTVEKGKLVVFNGAMLHHTIFPTETSDPLHLLGPFILTDGYGLQRVGQYAD